VSSGFAPPLRRHEQLAETIREHLTLSGEARTQDAIELRYGDERGVALLLTPEAIELRLPTVEWTGGAYAPANSTRLWKRVKLESVMTESYSWRALAPLVEKALAARKKEFRLCRYCKADTPVEHRTGRACHSCASKHEGIVY
jgi:hypothetical protein